MRTAITQTLEQAQTLAQTQSKPIDDTPKQPTKSEAPKLSQAASLLRAKPVEKTQNPKGMFNFAPSRNSVKKNNAKDVSAFNFDNISAKMLKLLQEKNIHSSVPTSDYLAIRNAAYSRT